MTGADHQWTVTAGKLNLIEEDDEKPQGYGREG